MLYPLSLQSRHTHHSNKAIFAIYTKKIKQIYSSTIFVKFCVCLRVCVCWGGRLLFGENTPYIKCICELETELLTKTALCMLHKKNWCLGQCGGQLTKMCIVSDYLLIWLCAVQTCIDNYTKTRSKPVRLQLWLQQITWFRYTVRSMERSHVWTGLISL